MSVLLESEAPPLSRDASGAIRVGHSRVLLELIVRAFQDGATSEEIAQRYPSASLPDIYGAIAYYLRHQSEIDQYLDERENSAQQIHKKIECHQGDLSALRQRIMSRQNKGV